MVSKAGLEESEDTQHHTVDHLTLSVSLSMTPFFVSVLFGFKNVDFHD